MSELDIEALKRSVVREGGCILVYASDWQAIIAALEDRKRLQKRYAEQTADCSQVSQRYEELLDQLEKYNYLEGIEAVFEDHGRLQEEVATLRTFVLRLDPDYEKNIELARQEIRHSEGQTAEELRAALEGRDWLNKHR